MSVVIRSERGMLAGKGEHWESCPRCKAGKYLILQDSPLTDKDPKAPHQYKLYCQQCQLTTNYCWSAEEAVHLWNENAIEYKKATHQLTDEEKIKLANPYLQPDWADRLVAQDSQFRLIQLQILCEGFNRIVAQLQKMSPALLSTDHQDTPQDLDGYLHQAMEAFRCKKEQAENAN